MFSRLSEHRSRFVSSAYKSPSEPQRQICFIPLLRDSRSNDAEASKERGGNHNSGRGLPPVLELVLEPRYERLQQLLQGVTQLIRSCSSRTLPCIRSSSRTATSAGRRWQRGTGIGKGFIHHRSLNSASVERSVGAVESSTQVAGRLRIPKPCESRSPQ